MGTSHYKNGRAMMTIFLNKGFTLAELLISLAIFSIVTAISITSYQHLLSDQSLSHAAKQIYYTLKLAKTEAIKRNQKIYVQFCQQQMIWKVGVSETAGCDCFTANSCQLDGVDQVQDIADGKRLFIKQDDIKFSNAQVSYGALRFSVETGSIVLTNNEEKSLSIIQSAMRLRVCAPDDDYLGYKQC
jgi:type IV fimbrial biogenesis protein FimT